MSTPITKEQFFAEAEERSTPAQVQVLKNLLPYLEAWTVLDLKYSQGDKHRTISASIVRRDGRTLVFGSYANGRAWCEYRTTLPDWVNEDQERRIADACGRYLLATGGDAGYQRREFDIDELPLFDLENAISVVSESLNSELV
jgi:hypothetical protein